MTSIVVRDLDEYVVRQLAIQAAEHGRSLDDEVCDILIRAVSRPDIGEALNEGRRDGDRGR